jgi:hypothetical protein
LLICAFGARNACISPTGTARAENPFLQAHLQKLVEAVPVESERLSEIWLLPSLFYFNGGFKDEFSKYDFYFTKALV